MREGSSCSPVQSIHEPSNVAPEQGDVAPPHEFEHEINHFHGKGYASVDYFYAEFFHWFMKIKVTLSFPVLAIGHTTVLSPAAHPNSDLFSQR